MFLEYCISRYNNKAHDVEDVTLLSPVSSPPEAELLLRYVPLARKMNASKSRRDTCTELNGGPCETTGGNVLGHYIQ